MSTARVALLGFLVGCGCGSKNEPAPRTAPCLPSAAAETGAGIGIVDGVEATVCFGASCLRLDRNGTPISAGGDLPPPAPAQVQQDRMIGTRTARRSPSGQWSLVDPETGKAIDVGTPGMRLDVLEPATVVVYQGTKLHVADAAALTTSKALTMPGTIAAVMPWFDRVFVVLDHPAGTMQIDPKTMSVYQGPPLPRCP